MVCACVRCGGEVQMGLIPSSSNTIHDYVHAWNGIESWLVSESNTRYRNGIESWIVSESNTRLHIIVQGVITRICTVLRAATVVTICDHPKTACDRVTMVLNCHGGGAFEGTVHGVTVTPCDLGKIHCDWMTVPFWVRQCKHRKSMDYLTKTNVTTPF